MRKRNIYNNYNYNCDDSYGNSFINKIIVNKKPNINSKTLRLTNNHRMDINNKFYKDNFYYENKSKRKKLSEEKSNKNVYYNREPYKKTINTYSNDNRMKERNIFEELQNNRYLRPMLGTTNIKKKLLKCKIEEPIKNIYTLSLRNYFANVQLPFQKCQSPQKQNIKDIYNEDHIYSYNFNNRTSMDRFNINANNDYLPYNEMIESVTYATKNNSNSFIYREDPTNYNKYLFRYSENNVKNHSPNQYGRLKNENNYYYDKKREKMNYWIKNKSPKIYHKNVISIRAPINVINKDICNNRYNLNLKNFNDSKNKEILLNIYKNKLIEEFCIVLNKFILKYFKKTAHFFLNNLINYNKKKKIYFKKKNSRTNIKKLSLNDNNIKFKINLHKNKLKITSDTLTNLNNKSFSNEFKLSSIADNFRANNNIVNKFNSSFVQSEQKEKKFYKSPENSLNKSRQTNIRQKVIVRPKKSSGSQNKNSSIIRQNFETRESSGDKFVYKKKNMNNDNLSINKNNKINNLSYTNNNYKNIISNNKKGKIIDIDINLGKPVSIINDHSPLEEYFLNNKSELFQLNTISSKFNNNNKNIKKKRHKAKSGSKNKIKPPLRLKRFVEEDDCEEDNFSIDNKKANSSMRREKVNNNINLLFGNNTVDINKTKENAYKDSENKEEKICIRFNHYSFNSKNENKNGKRKRYKFLRIKKETNICLNNDYKNEEILQNSIVSDKNKRNKTNKLYINCTKFLEKIFNRIIKKKVFIIIKRFPQ